MGQNWGLRSSNSKAIGKVPSDGASTRTTRHRTSWPDCGLIGLSPCPTDIRKGASSRPPWAFTTSVNACARTRFPPGGSAARKTATWSNTI